MAYILTRVPASGVINSAASVDISSLVAAIAASLIAQLILARQLSVLANEKGAKVTPIQALQINCRTLFYGLFLPGGNITQGTMRTYQLSSLCQSMKEAIYCVVFDRITVTVTVILIGLFFWLVDFRHTFDSFLIAFLSITIAILFAGAYLLLRKVRECKHFLRITIIGKAPKKIHNLTQQLVSYISLSKGSIAHLITLSTLAHLLGILTYYLLSISMGIDLSFVALAWIRSAVVVISMFPFSVSGFGLREGALIILLSRYEVSMEDSITLSILIFGASRLSVWALGGLFESRKLVGILPVK